MTDDFHRTFTAVGGSEEVVTPGGVIIPEWGGRQRAWVKVAGEPAQILVETPIEFMERWSEWQARVAAWEHIRHLPPDDPIIRAARPDVLRPPVLVMHDFTYGQAMFFFPGMELAYVGVTHPTHTQSQTKPGSIYAGQCRCGDVGGPCPRSRGGDA